MARGDYEGDGLAAMARRAAEPRADPYVRALDALRVAPQLTASELQVCIAFRVDPFSFLLAKEQGAETIRREREESVRLDAFRERERRTRESWGSA